MRTALVFAGGDPPPPATLDGLATADVVVAADSGVGHALALGTRVDLVVGDLDSASPRDVERVVRDGAKVESHPREKDATDLELALEAVRDLGAEMVVVVGAGGGRLDHFFANLLVLAAPAFSAMRVSARIDAADLFVVREHVELHGAVGDLCSLLPLGGPAAGVLTRGLRYPLRREALAPGTTRGVSNELVDEVASVTLSDGVLVAVLPHARKAVR